MYIYLYIKTGKKCFQFKSIRISYRRRITVPRTQIYEKQINLITSPDNRGLTNKKKIIYNILINIIVRYSLIKSMTNPTPLYSVINPLINSDGLSEKSKGRRLLSASNKINTNSRRGNKIIIPILIKFSKKYLSLTLFKKKTILSKKNLKQSS